MAFCNLPSRSPKLMFFRYANYIHLIPSPKSQAIATLIQNPLNYISSAQQHHILSSRSRMSSMSETWGMIHSGAQFVDM